MKFAFFGTPRFAAIFLERILNEGLIPCTLICNPDKPMGRKKVITPPKTKIVAADWNKDIEILQPEELNEEFTEKLRSLHYDFFLVAAYAKILPKEIIDLPRLGTIGIHPSLLPKYRGASPIQSAILNGEEKTGVTIYQMDDKMDTGPILSQTEVKIEDFGYCELEEKLALAGAKLFTEIALDFLAGKIEPQIQDESATTYTKKIKTEDAFVDLEKDDPKKIKRIIRALNPEPGVWTMQDGKRIKIIEATVDDTGKLVLKKIQKENGKTENC